MAERAARSQQDPFAFHRSQTSLDLGLGLPISAHGLIGDRRAFIAGVPINRDAFVAEAGLDLRVAPSATLGIAYTGQTGSRAQDQAVKGNFTYRF